LSQTLLNQEVLEGDALRQVLNRVQAPAGLDRWLQTGKFDATMLQAV
jgi:cell division protease FtsH